MSEVLGVTGNVRAVTWMGIRAAVAAVEVFDRMAWIDINALAAQYPDFAPRDNVPPEELGGEG